MKQNIIITIGRQNGSGGREVGKKLAEKLGIPFYDKELIQMAAKKCGIDETIAKENEETATNSLLYSLSTGAATIWNSGILLESDLPLTDRIYIAQSEIIRKFASEGDCVIVGRCADEVLKNNPNCINVFIHADINYRVNRMTHLHNLTEEKAIKQIKRMDKKRSNYYNYFTDKKWGDLQTYNVTLDTSKFGIDLTVDILEKIYKDRKAKQKV